jgi:hypothetical protein
MAVQGVIRLYNRMRLIYYRGQAQGKRSARYWVVREILINSRFILYHRWGGWPYYE